MEQLTGLDAAFLALEEQPGVYGHVGSVIVVDPSTMPSSRDAPGSSTDAPGSSTDASGSSTDAPGSSTDASGSSTDASGSSTAFDLDHVRALIESRLHLLPPFRRRLVEVPFGIDQPYWLEDPDFDIEYHVREIALPAPGDHEQLATQAARLHARHLDRRRPLWELYLIHGLEGGHVAIYTKVHHAAIDGVSGNDLLAAVLDPTPEGRQLPPPPPHVGEQPDGAGRMLLRGLVSLAVNPLRVARFAYGLARSLPAVASSPVRPHLPVIDRLLGRDEHVVLEQPSLRAPTTPFNQPVGPHRRWAFGDLPLEDVKAIKNAAGVTVNDVVMTLCAGALRRWLLAHGALPDEPLVASIPVSVRTGAEQGDLGNRVSAMIAPLPTNVDDPVGRLRAVAQVMTAAKTQHEALPADVLADATRFAMPALAGQAARLAARLKVMERVSPFNLIISNVPGPRVPLYYGGALMVAYYPLSAIADGQGLNITVLSYRDTIFYGLTADRELVPDVDVLGHHLEEELTDLRKALESLDR